MMVGIPLLQLMLFGFAINSDPRHLPTALRIADHGQFARTLVAALRPALPDGGAGEPTKEPVAQNFDTQFQVATIIGQRDATPASGRGIEEAHDTVSWMSRREAVISYIGTEIEQAKNFHGDAVNALVIATRIYDNLAVALAVDEPTTPKGGAGDADGWVEWHGGECPVPGLTDVEVRYRSGIHSYIAADEQDWVHDPSWPSVDIIAYRIVPATPTEESGG